MTDFWTPQRVNILKEQWAVGSSGSVIAAKLGCSRNAVIGKSHRLKLPRRSSMSSTPKKQSVPKPKKTKEVRVWNNKGIPVAPSPVKDSNTLTPTAKSLMDLGNKDCRFPIGEFGAPGSGFCGRDKKEGSPYCEVHWKITNIPAPTKVK